MSKKRNQLIAQNRVKAISEELAGFILTHVVDEFGEFHYVEKKTPSMHVLASGDLHCNYEYFVCNESTLYV